MAIGLDPFSMSSLIDPISICGTKCRTDLTRIAITQANTATHTILPHLYGVKKKKAKNCKRYWQGIRAVRAIRRARVGIYTPQASNYLSILKFPIRFGSLRRSHSSLRSHARRSPLVSFHHQTILFIPSIMTELDTDLYGGQSPVLSFSLILVD